jgi:hypothetical protein
MPIHEVELLEIMAREVLKNDTYLIQAGLNLRRGYVPEKHRANRTQFPFKNSISRGLDG